MVLLGEETLLQSLSADVYPVKNIFKENNTAKKTKQKKHKNDASPAEMNRTTRNYYLPVLSPERSLLDNTLLDI